MNKNEFSLALAMAQDRNIDLSNVDDTHLDGCGLPTFDKVATSIKAVAKLIRWQAQYLNGSWDMDEINNLRNISRRKFEIVMD